MTDQPNTHSKKLTAAEISALWNDYAAISISQLIFEHFTDHVEDTAVKELVQDALTFANRHLARIVSFFTEAAFPIPIGFTGKDGNRNAPRLYTDEYYIHNIRNFAELGMGITTMSIVSASNPDLYAFYSETYQIYNTLHKKASVIGMEKGILTLPPIVPFPYEKDFVESERFLAPGWLLQERRPLLASEITTLYTNMVHNLIGVMTITGFSQVAQKAEVRNFFLKGIELGKKQINIYAQILQEFEVPVPSLSNALVTASNTVSPFSDKLMVQETCGMIAVGMADIGKSFVHTMRSDIQGQYAKISTLIAKYSKEGADLMIKNGWLEQPPQTIDRKALAKESRKGE